MNPTPTPALQPADLAWMLVSIALVMLMIPGLGLFYAGMVRAKNVLATMMQAMSALAVVGTLWITLGYALAFGDDVGGLGVLGFSPTFIALHGVTPAELWPGSGVPIWVHATFQGLFAVITPALVAGALAERLRFSAWCLWMAAWSLLVYAPLAHMVWHPEGWLFRLGALDFAGGTVVHVAAGVSALVAAKLVRQRHGWPERPIHPSGAAHTLLGAGLLWVGWFGFNGGSALAATASAGLAVTVTHVAACAGAAGWVGLEWRKSGKPTAIGFASGAVAGLVGITPAAGYVGPASAIVIGLCAAAACYAFVTRKARLGLDDALDAFGVHGVGGAVGALLTGVFADARLYGGAGGALLDGNVGQLGIQALSVVATVAFAGPLTALLVFAIGRDRLAVDPRTEEQGLDGALHGERAFDFAEDAVTALDIAPRPATRPPVGAALTLTISGFGPGELSRRWAAACARAPADAAMTELLHCVTRVREGEMRLCAVDAAWAVASVEAAMPGCVASISSISKSQEAQS